MVWEISLLAIKMGHVGIFELFWPDTGINLCAGQVFMSKQFLYDTNIGAIFQKVTRK